MTLLENLRNWNYSPDIAAEMKGREFAGESGTVTTRLYLLGLGQRNPYYTPPAGFVQRRGTAAADAFFSGTYQASGKRIGLLRIPHFAPANALNAVRELEGEIAYFRANTDALVVDVTRNTGGGCIGLDYAQRLMTRDFTTFSEHLRPTQVLLANASAALRQARAARAEEWVIATYERLVEELIASGKENRSMTGPIPACSPVFGPSFPAVGLTQEPFRNPDGTLGGYDKPIVFLVDELSLSFGDIFPAMMQDNRRGPIVGMRTGGLGGSVTGWGIGTYSESPAFVTNSVVVRGMTVKAGQLPAAPYIENIGVIPDIELNYMTRDNLLTRGRPYFEELTKIVLSEIGKAN